jgi:rhodanese-related sulfurtransferase
MKKYLMLAMAVGLGLALAMPVAVAKEKSPLRASLVRMIKDARTTHPQISVHEAKILMATNKKLLIIDVRTLAEFKAGSVPGANHIPRGLLEFKLIKREKNLDRAILVYCKSGARASFAGLQLKKLGYKNVKNMTGGYLAWAKAAKAANVN